MSHVIHMCISVRGVLSRTDRDLVKEWGHGALSHKGKKLYTAMEIREAFFDELAEGHEVIPLGKCDNFDYKTGCRGHEMDDKPVADLEPLAKLIDSADAIEGMR
jgi:hypothetical protein